MHKVLFYSHKTQNQVFNAAETASKVEYEKVATERRVELQRLVENARKVEENKLAVETSRRLEQEKLSAAAVKKAEDERQALNTVLVSALEEQRLASEDVAKVTIPVSN